MHISPEGIAEIAGHEGIVLEPYLDSVGVWTIGVGHTAAAGEPDPAKMRGQKITLEDALLLFDNDLDRFEARVRKHMKDPTQHQFDAGVSFDYNTGGIHNAWWVRSHNAGDHARAATQILNWKKPPEIIGRRKMEQALYRDGTYHPAPTPIYTHVSASGRVDYGKRDLIEDDDLLRLMERGGTFAVADPALTPEEALARRAEAYVGNLEAPAADPSRPAVVDEAEIERIVRRVMRETWG